MNETECLSVYDEFVQYLQELQLDWVVRQAQKAINEGKIIKTKGRKDEIIKEYTPQEKLILLIDTIQRAIVDTFEIENEVYKFLQAESNSKRRMNKEIKFISSDEEEARTVTFNESQFNTSLLSKDDVNQLKNDLEQLRSEVLNSAC